VQRFSVEVDLPDAALRLTGRPVEVSKVKHMVGKRTDSDAVTMPEGTPTAAVEENVEPIGTWERESLLSRSKDSLAS